MGLIKKILKKAVVKAAETYLEKKTASVYVEHTKKSEPAKAVVNEKPKQTTAETPKTEQTEKLKAEKVSEPKKTEPIDFPHEKPVEVPQIKLTMSEAQRAGFQFKYGKRNGNAVITSIHVRSDKVIIPAYIDGHAVTVITEKCRCIIDKNVKDVRLYLPDTLCIIGDSAFRVSLYKRHYQPNEWQPVFSEVYFPKRANVCEYAFYGQKNLKKLHFGEHTFIDDSAFEYCTSLKSVHLDGCYLQNNAFAHCSALNTVTGAYSGGAVVYNTFMDTPYLKNQKMIIVGKSLQKYYTTENTVTVPDGIEYIGEYCFAFNPTEKVILPKSVKSIGTGAFGRCPCLKSIDASGVNVIHRDAFKGCSKLVNVKLNDDVRLESGCFDGTPFAEQKTTADGTIINSTLLAYSRYAPKTVFQREFPEKVRVVALDSDDPSLRFMHGTVIFHEKIERVDNISVFARASKIIFRNPDVKVNGENDSFKYIFKETSKSVVFEVNGTASEFPVFIPRFRTDNDAYRKEIVSFYNRFFKNMDINFYDSGILDLDIGWQRKLEIAYKRLMGGFGLTEKHRRMYEDFARTHKKKGIKYTEKYGDREHLEQRHFFEIL